MTGPTPTLRVLTMNLLAPANGDWPRRRVVIARMLRHLEPDVVALQEVDVEDASNLLPGYRMLPHPVPGPDGVGAVLAARNPIRLVREVDLHLTARVTLPWSAAVIAEVDLGAPFGPVLIVHHKPTWQAGAARERELQAVATASAVEDVLAGVEDRHVVVLGDFDEPPHGASIRFWTGNQSLEGASVAYRDVWEWANPGDPGHTFTPENPLVEVGEMSLDPGRRIDYVLVRCGPHGPTLDVLGCERVLAGPVDGVWASDHYGLLATLRLPSHPPGTWAEARSPRS